MPEGHHRTGGRARGQPVRVLPGNVEALELLAETIVALAVVFEVLGVAILLNRVLC